jgi:ABC-type cobalt transport system substrate-binding protein
MKVKDLLEFNPDAELCIIGSDYVAKPLAIYGWGGSDGSGKKDCTSVDLKYENWIENNEK